MCSSAILPIVAGAGIATQLASQSMLIDAEEQAAVFNAKTMRYNAAIMSRNASLQRSLADDARLRGDIAANKNTLYNRMLVGKQQATFAGSGVAVDSGSPLSVVMDTIAFGELESRVIKFNAEQEAGGLEQRAQGFQAESKSLLAQASFTEAAGKRSKTLPMLNTILTGAWRIGASYGAFG